MAKSNPLSLAELQALLPRLQATVELLIGASGTGRRRGRPPGPSAAAAPTAKRGRKARRARVSGAESERLREKLFATLKGSKSGLALSEVVSRTGAPKSAVGFQLRRLRQLKRVRVVGDRGEARWFAAK